MLQQEGNICVLSRTLFCCYFQRHLGDYDPNERTTPVPAPLASPLAPQSNRPVPGYSPKLTQGVFSRPVYHPTPLAQAFQATDSLISFKKPYTPFQLLCTTRVLSDHLPLQLFQRLFWWLLFQQIPCRHSIHRGMT